jgi:hypothetical protein
VTSSFAPQGFLESETLRPPNGATIIYTPSFDGMGDSIAQKDAGGKWGLSRILRDMTVNWKKTG